MNISGKIHVFRAINFRVIFRQTTLYCILPLIIHITVIRINFVHKNFVLEIFMQQYFCSYQMRCHIFTVYRLVKNRIKNFRHFAQNEQWNFRKLRYIFSGVQFSHKPGYPKIFYSRFTVHLFIPTIKLLNDYVITWSNSWCCAKYPTTASPV